MNRPTIKLFGERAILYQWPDDISEVLFRAVSSWKTLLEQQLGPFIEEAVPAYSSIAVYLKPSARMEDFISLVDSVSNYTSQEVSGRHIRLPVCYGPPYGEDIEQVAQRLGTGVSEIIEKHSKPEYLVHFIGFLPGFPYLGGLSPDLYLPRRANPRRLVASGSVAIGGRQTGIYTTHSPGGWHILGRTPVRLFDPSQERPSLLRPGDRIKFYPVSESRYKQIVGQIKSGSFNLKIDNK
jgi:inhibitor of KinA